MNERGSLWKKVAYFLGGILFFLLLWWLLNILLLENDLHYLPSPWEIFARLGLDLFGKRASLIYPAIGYSVLKLLIGFSLSFLLAALLGTLAGFYEGFRFFIKSHVLIMASVPTVGVAMILGTAFWLEVPILQAYIPSILVFLVAFPILMNSFIEGISSLPSEERNALRIEGLEKSWGALWGVYYPEAAPYILLGLGNAFGLSFKVTIMSEIVTNSGTRNAMGLGTLIGKAIQLEADLEEAIALSLLTVLLVFIVDGSAYLIKRVAKKKA